MCPKMAGGEGVMPHLHLARGERKDRGTAMCAGARSEKNKKKQPNQTKINNPTQRGQKQQVETGHKAEQDLGCKTAERGVGWGQTGRTKWWTHMWD